jgi:hypothetical protein
MPLFVNGSCWAQATVRQGSLEYSVVAVGTTIADRPPHRSVRAALPHTAPTLEIGENAATRTPLSPGNTRSPRCVGDGCGVERCSPWPAPFSPQAPPKIALLCSSGSSIVWRGPTPLERARPPCGFAPSRAGLVPFRPEALQRSPGSRACCFSACAGSSTTQDRQSTRDYRDTAVLPSSNQERVGVLVLRFSKLNSPAHRYPCLRFKRHLAMSPARLRAKMESLSPSL